VSCLRRKIIPAICLAALAAGFAGRVPGEEIWLSDASRVYGLVQRVIGKKNIGVLLADGREAVIPLEKIISIRFLGRDPLLIQTGTQEFKFINGGRLRGQILGNRGDRIRLQTAIAGVREFDLKRFKGFVALPLGGYIGRRAEDLVESSRGRFSPFEDLVLDRRGGSYPGVLRSLERTRLYFDLDGLLQVKPFPIHYIKGVRLADAGRDKARGRGKDVGVFVWTRDGSLVQGRLKDVRLGKWHLIPAWDPTSSIEINLDEIVQVQTLGGQVQYLSQLPPLNVKSRPVLTPPQPHRMDRSCQGDSISIAGNRYPWGIGVHANSELSFRLDGAYQQFMAAAGIDTRMGARGSVRFIVIGDGRELHRSPVVRGSRKTPHEIKVSVKGVKVLTLKVTDAGDLDLGDVANWGSARVLRFGLPVAPAKKGDK